MSWVDNLSSKQWAQIIQKSAGVELETAASGSLEVSGKSVTIKIEKSYSKEATSLSLEDIISVSKQKFEGLGKVKDGESSLIEKEIVFGLCKLKDKLQNILVDKGLYGTKFQNDLMFFEDDLENILKRFKTEKTGKTEKERLLELTIGEPINESHLSNIQEIIKGDRNHLFDLTEYSESFLDLTTTHSSSEFQTTLAIDILMNLGTLNTTNSEWFKQYLFDKSSGADSIFETFMKREESNTYFDVLLKFVDDEELNKLKDRKTQILNFAFSIKRYNHACMRGKGLSSSLLSEVDSLVSTWKLNLEGTIEEKYASSTTIGSYEAWREKVMSKSTTISARSEAAIRSRDRWIEAQRYISSQAALDRGTTNSIDFNMVSTTHEKLAKGELGINNPGKLRENIVRTSGGWTALYPPPRYLDKNITEFMSWFNEGLLQCERNEKNPVIHAAQTFERLVSIHPFENGNGRVSQLLMGYVLERFDIPPPFLGEDVEAVVFPLRRVINQGEFLRKVIQGIKKSKRYFV